MSTPESIADNLARVRARIAHAAQSARADRGPVTLLAVSKTWPAAAVRAAYRAGQRDFGESYAQEARGKMEELGDLGDIRWHFIGPMQANKTQLIASRFHWVHSLDRPRIAERLAAQRPPEMPPLNVCIQININRQASKSGIVADELPGLLAATSRLSGLRLRGLMCIPDPQLDEAGLRASFAALRHLLEHSRSACPTLDTLSMGMSDDLELAIAEGATLVRVGSAIFGERQ